MKYSYLTLFSAFILAGCGALVSVFGLGALFAGAGTGVLVMVGGLEFSKLVATGALHRYWGNLSWLFKIPFTLAIIVMMGLTSLGIYGFLSDGYQKTASQYELQVGKTKILEDKSAVFSNRIVSNEKIIEAKTKRAETLSELRAQQEVRLDSLYAKNYISNANKVRLDIEEATEEIKGLTSDVDALLVTNGVLADSVNVYAQKINEVEEASTLTAELGPLIYLSNLTGLPMDTVVNYLIFLIIGVFDPTAVGLLILASSIVKIEEAKRSSEPKVTDDKPSYLKRLVEKFKTTKTPDDYVDNDPETEAWRPVVDPESGEIDLSNAPELSDNKEIWLGTPDEYPEPEELIDPVAAPATPVVIPKTSKVEPKSVPNEEVTPPKRTVDIVLERERAKKAEEAKTNKRKFSVNVPDPKPRTEIKAPEPTKLGKVWKKKG